MYVCIFSIHIYMYIWRLLFCYFDRNLVIGRSSLTHEGNCCELGLSGQMRLIVTSAIIVIIIVTLLIAIILIIVVIIISLIIAIIIISIRNIRMAPPSLSYLMDVMSLIIISIMIAMIIPWLV